MALPGAASADNIFGAGGIITNRNCPANSGSCVQVIGGSPGFTGPLLNRNYYGGYGQGISTGTVGLSSGASGFIDASFSQDYLPVVKVQSAAGAETRTGASATAFRAFTYNGPVAIDFALQGQLHFFTSGDVDQPGQFDEFAGDGTLNVVLSLLTVPTVAAAFPPSARGIDIISNSSIGFPDCGSAGVVATSGFNSGGFSAGEYNQTVSLSQSCSGGAIRLNPGDSFVVIASLQAISNRGGFLDAAHTFRVQYDEANTFIAGTQQVVEQGFLSANVSEGAAVPEPAAWALMIGGFGVAGAALRRRRVAAA